MPLNRLVREIKLLTNDGNRTRAAADFAIGQGDHYAIVVSTPSSRVLEEALQRCYLVLKLMMRAGSADR